MCSMTDITPTADGRDLSAPTLREALATRLQTEDRAFSREGATFGFEASPQSGLQIGSFLVFESPHGDLLGQRPVVELRQERPSLVEGLVPGPSLAGDHRVDDDFVAVGVDAGTVTAEDHRQAIGRQPDALQ